MLARGTRPLYVCLQCHRYLLDNNHQRSGAAYPIVARLSRRWQSAAARRVALEELDQDYDNDRIREGRGEQHQSRHDGRTAHTSTRQRFRTWRPRPTAELGVNSLGKPAEVLLLPSRDRRITRVPKSDGSGRAGTTLQESIDSEKAPLSGAKLAENIEHVRALVGKMRGQLEKHEWKTLRTRLRSGFQTEQLKRYIRLQEGEHFPPEGLPSNPKKEAIIRYMAEEIWGCTTPVRDESPASSDHKSKQSRLSYVLKGNSNVVQLEHLLRHPSQPLKKIAEEHHVQISVHPSESRIKTVGSSSNANKALQRIIRYTKELGLVTVPLQGPLVNMMQDHGWQSYLTAYLKSLQRKYRALTIAQEDGEITIAYLANPRTAAQARREILISAPATAEIQQSGVWLHGSTMSLQPFPTPAELPLMLRHYSWSRLVSASIKRRVFDRFSRSASFNSILQGLRDAFSKNAIVGKAGNRQERYYDVTARFGQSLRRPKALSVKDHTVAALQENDQPDEDESPQTGAFAEKNSPKRGALTHINPVEPGIESRSVTTESTSDTYSGAPRSTDKGREEVVSPSALLQNHRVSSVFIGGAPFLTQHLFSMSPWISQSTRGVADVDENARAVLRLELTPILAPKSKGSPVFEVLLAASEQVEEQRPRLRIARVTAIHHEDHFTVLCPQSVVDVKFTRQLKQDLTYPGSAEMDITEPLMNALRVYIGHAQTTGTSDWVFRPFVTLPNHYTFRGGHARDLKPKPWQPLSFTRAADRKVEYLLRSVDVVDVDSRLFSVHSAARRSEKPHIQKSDFCLDHITYTGADTTRQDLRLGRSSMLHSPTLEQPDMVAILRAALKLAERLSANPLKPDGKLDGPATDLDDIEIEETKPTSKPMKKEADPKDAAKPAGRKANKAPKTERPIEKPASSKDKKGLSTPGVQHIEAIGPRPAAKEKSKYWLGRNAKRIAEPEQQRAENSPKGEQPDRKTARISDKHAAVLAAKLGNIKYKANKPKSKPAARSQVKKPRDVKKGSPVPMRKKAMKTPKINYKQHAKGAEKRRRKAGASSGSEL